MTIKLTSKEIKLLQKYESNLKIYRQFAILINSKLKKILKEYKFFYQVTQKRVKRKKSLIPKLFNVKKLESINDIVACRIIFYQESDIKIFSQFLYSNFKIIDYIPRYSKDNYNSDHYIISLNEDEISDNNIKFSGIKCELQLTTVLYHAWSEIAHNTIYKSNDEIKTFDKKAFSNIELTFAETMKNHLKESAFRFEYINESIKNIEKAVEVFDLKSINEIITLKSHNDIFDRLVSLKDYINKYGDKFPEQIRLIDFIKNIMENSKLIKDHKLNNKVYFNHNNIDVLIICLEILNLVPIRYKYFLEIFELLLELFNLPNENLKEQVYKNAKEMSEFHYYLVDKNNKVNINFQMSIINEIVSWSSSKLIDNSDFIIETLKPIFSVEFRDIKWESIDSISNITHTFKSTKGLRKLREEGIQILMKLFLISSTKTRISILKVFNIVGSNHIYDENYNTIANSRINYMIQKQLIKITEFYLKIFLILEPILILLVDKQINQFEKWFPNLNLNKLRGLIDYNSDYQNFKVITSLLGLNNLDWQEEKKYRSDVINNFVNQLTDTNKEKYIYLILHINEFNDYEKLNICFFEIFISSIAMKNAKFLYEVLERYEYKLKQDFLCIISTQLFKSEFKDKILLKIKNWINDNKNIRISLKIVLSNTNPKLNIINLILKKIISNNDLELLNYIVKEIINIPKSKSLFFKALNKLTKLQNSQWSNHLDLCNLPLFNELTETEINKVLINFEYADDINNSIENLLVKIARYNLDLVINFFYTRVKLDKRDDFDRLDNIIKVFRENENVIFEKIFNWENEYFNVGADILQVLILEMSNEMKIKVQNIIETGTESELNKLVKILDYQCLMMSNSFKLPTSIKNLFKILIIKHYPRYKNTIFTTLSEPGLVMGWDGYAKAYNIKLSELEEWELEQNPNIKKFLKEYKKYLNHNFISHQKMEDSEYNLRKLEFNANYKS